jgi:hypothetical protein
VLEVARKPHLVAEASEPTEVSLSGCRINRITHPEQAQGLATQWSRTAALAQVEKVLPVELQDLSLSRSDPHPRKNRPSV